MTIAEIASFADKFATHNERMVITLKDKATISGHFYNNPKQPHKTDNHWKFVILKTEDCEKQDLVLNGDDIEDIRKVRLF